MWIPLLSNLSMISLVIGTLPSFKALLKNRKELRGFSFIGVIGIFLGQLGFTTYFGLGGDYLSTLFALPLDVYWLLVLYYLNRNKRARSVQ